MPLLSSSKHVCMHIHTLWFFLSHFWFRDLVFHSPCLCVSICISIMPYLVYIYVETVDQGREYNIFKCIPRLHRYCFHYKGLSCLLPITISSNGCCSIIDVYSYVFI
ncbi:hypothetical protein BDF19DRAFT_453906 [Syncephalis fuscata]|nr:hypothetical protein BDF19DRAFT_453906 [Syncephalis fuscata]